MQTKLTILIEKSEDYINKLPDEVMLEDNINEILNSAGMKAEVVGKVKHEMEGTQDWCKNCSNKITDHDSRVCDECREQYCNTCEIAPHMPERPCSSCPYQKERGTG